MICHMFEGQPVSWVNPPKSENSFLDIAEKCLSITGFDPLTGLSKDPEVTESVRLQLLGVCCSIWKARQIAITGTVPDVVAEHSMGVYPALVECGAISLDAAVEMTFRVGIRMAEAFRNESYALGCVIGLAASAVESVSANHEVYVANYNTSRHFLLAGREKSIETALAECTAAGAFSISSFTCDAPLHTPLMEVIEYDLKEIFADYNYHEPIIPIMEHFGQQFMDAPVIPGFLKNELCRPVYWETTYRALKKFGAVRFVEVGTAQALTKFNRWIASES